MAERGFKLGEALKSVAADDDARATPKDQDAALAEKIGRSFITNLLDRVAGQAAQGGAPGADPMDQADKAVELVKKLRGLGADDDEDETRALPKRLRKLLRRLEDDDEDERPVRRGGREDSSMFKVMADMQKGMFEILDRMDERQADRMDALRKEMRDHGRDKDKSEDSFWRDQATQALMGKLNSNPLQEYMAMRDHFRNEFEGSGGHDVETFLAKERVGIEKMKAQAEIEREDKRTRLQSDFVENLPMILGKRKGGGQQGGEAPGLFRLVCGACGHDWLTSDDPRQYKTVICPKCREETEIPGDPGAGDGQ